ncbi:MAG: flagellar biosynthetic protein FliQ [Sphingopyxis sp.]|mgnify:CR=1 FL=1|jgi:flagellar biosynthetic protein FliQ|nr:flagellar biosynthetic protein FliQ [Sphingopyxis sp.]
MADSGYFISVTQSALWVLGLACIPILVPALITGLVVGFIQAATSINEATLAFVIKLIVIGVCLAIFGASIMGLFVDFTREIYDRIPDVVR